MRPPTIPSRKRQVLHCLDKRTLIDISEQFGFTGISGQKKTEIAAFLSRKGSVKVEQVLADLKMPMLKNVCWNLGVNFGAAKKQVLIDRILGKESEPSSDTAVQ